MAQGALTLQNSPQKGYTFAAGSHPYGVAVSPDGNNLYAALRDVAFIGQLAIGTDGTLTTIAGKSATFAATTQCRYVTVSPDGLNVYATSANGYLYTFSRAADGSLSMPIARIAVPYALGVMVSPDNKHIYVSSYTGNVVKIYSRDLQNNGAPTEIGSVTVPGPRGLLVTPDGSGFYVVSDSTNCVHCFTRDTSNGASAGLLTALTTPNDKIATPSAFPNAITCTTDSAFIYVATDSGNQFTGCYSRAANNVLTDIGHHAAINGGIWNIAVARDSGNTSLFVGASDSQKIYQYDRSNTPVGGNGGLTPKTPTFATTSNYVAGTPAGSAGPYDMAVSPNNKFLFATAMLADTVDVFAIEQPPGNAGNSGSTPGGIFNRRSRTSRRVLRLS